MVDRSKRYDKSQKKKDGAPGGTEEAKGKAEATASGKDAPHPKDQPEKTSDPGPEAGHDAAFGVVAERHKREHADMSKRHVDEHAAMVEKHAKEAKDMHVRHGKEMVDAVSGAKAAAEASAGEPPKATAEKTATQKTENKGKGGSSA
jgi:hypothetical protein